MNIPIIYEDDWLLVVDKPSGLLVIPTPKRETRTLTSILNLHPCHRLDRETSGLIIYAKTKAIQNKMMEQFKLRQVNKLYIAFVQGQLPQNQGQINSHIEGKSALTKYKVTQRKNDFTVVEVMPLTGRTNQIRIHFKQMNHPVVGDTKFAFRKDFSLRSKRLCLQAKELGFRHPATNEYTHLSIDLAKDLQEFLDKYN